MILAKVGAKVLPCFVTVLIVNKLKRIFSEVPIYALLLAALSSCGGDKGKREEPDPNEPVQTVFALGADISWASEMEADGVKYRTSDGKEADLFIVLKETGVNAIRLRVWVNPVGGRWSGKRDMVSLAKRAASAGMRLMVDFHYSDLFADPQRQIPSAAWAAFDLARMKTALADHTKDVLTALKTAGLSPEWVQVGNETRNGMLWPLGRLWDTKAGFDSGPTRSGIPGGWERYVSLNNAGYDAVKSIFPETKVLVHIDNAWDTSTGAGWFGQFKGRGGKMDMIGLSHYPQKAGKLTWKQANAQAVESIRTLSAKYGMEVMVVETGVLQSDLKLGAEVMVDFLGAVAKLDGCKGVFYWEPECYGGWKPAFYSFPEYGWSSYDMGAFTSGGRAGPVLGCFRSFPVCSAAESFAD